MDTAITLLAVRAITDTTRLQDLIGRLAARWRGAGIHQNLVAQDEIQQVYHAAVERLLELGYTERGGLDVESELPDAHMPKAYLDRFPTLDAS